jgi:short chain dehydrogenase
MLEPTRLWDRLKRWRRFGIGRIAVLFKFERIVRITPGELQRSSYRPSSRSPKQDQAGFAEVRSTATQPSSHSSASPGTAVIVGVGPGFGYALARRLVTEGFDVVLVSRDASSLDVLLGELRKTGRQATSYGADAQTNALSENSLTQ